ncbi:MAG: DUF488 domain-containing protein [Synechococcales cyanobacterium T60_A2020_003]|nr:DUF488 domain-containing protein [Synechococcales cyanobacterium T60_A2020_003]
MELLTIGHSNYEIRTFVSLLQKHGVTAVVDVRSSPYSRFLPHFNRAALKEALATEKILYVFLGQELGARPKKQECYVKGKAVYEKIAATEEFHEGIQRVLKGVKKHKVSLMCAEKDPLTCHRAILVCQHLRRFDLQINHILRNGELESHDHLEQRMLKKHGFTDFSEMAEEQAQLSLFTQKSSNLSSREECLDIAYKIQGDEIAYVEKKGDDHDQANQPVHDWIHPKERSEIL